MDVDLEDRADKRIVDLDELHVPGRDLRFRVSEVGCEVGIILELRSRSAFDRNAAFRRSFDGQ